MSVSVLLAEDSAIQGLLIQKTLTAHGYVVRLATNGVEAIAMIQDETPDLLISDLLMPGMDGFELCRQVRMSEPGADIPIVILTASLDPENLIKGLKAGATGFINKPADSDFLLNQLEHILETHRLRMKKKDKKFSRIVHEGIEHTIELGCAHTFEFLMSAIENAAERHRLLTEANIRLAEMRAELEMVSLTDELTGLYNRRGFAALAEKLLARAKRDKSMATLMFADMDGLKYINDQLGHDAGDAAIRAFGEFLQLLSRDSDVVGRLSGDEFVMLMPDCTEDQANTIVKRLHHLLEEGNTARLEDLGYALSASIGLAEYDPTSPRKLTELMAAADRAMYTVKQTRPGARRG